MSRLDKRVAFGQVLGSRKDEECTPDIVMVGGFGNTGIIFTEEGVVVVDTAPMSIARVVEVIRARTDKPIHTIIYTHGQGDHAWAAAPLLEDAVKRGHPRPRVIAQEALLARFARYKELARQNRFINNIQGGRTYVRPQPGDKFMPDNVVYPDITYRDAMQFRLGGLTFELYHYMGETDDGTWVWIPERKTAITGDLNVGCPNIGNPFKVQRYEVEWAEALEQVAEKNPDYLIPGHGVVLRGQGIQEACLVTAKYLRYLHNEVVKLLNEGCWIEEILERVSIPDELAKHPYLPPIYGCPTYIIHGIHRRYAGWFNGNPGELFPAKRRDIAAEVVKLSNADSILKRAKELQKQGNVQLALHLADFVVYGSADAVARKEAFQLKAALLDEKADKEYNTIAKNIFLVGAQKAEDEAQEQ
ncbi:MAG: alkyl sulfatase dimerization domain-containing protein [Dehalococcoidia bacterium]|nr:alkyl sulfatase dimerization domain-containing protein [Dehalococcoidia bacterium]